MTVAFVVLSIVAVASILGSAYYAVRLIHASAENAIEHVTVVFERRLAEQDAAEEGRRQAIYKQQKEMHRAIAVSDRAVRKMADHSSALRDEAIAIQQRMDARLREEGS